MSVTLTLDGLQIGRVRQLTDTSSTDYRRGGPSIPPPPGGGDDPPRRRPGGGRGDGDRRPSRLELLAVAMIVAAQILLCVLLSLLPRGRLA